MSMRNEDMQELSNTYNTLSLARRRLQTATNNHQAALTLLETARKEFEEARSAFDVLTAKLRETAQ